MAYSSDISRTLTDQIAKFITLNRHQLAGQVANLDFWAAEVRHCLDVIDGYPRRFERMKVDQMRYVSKHKTVENNLDYTFLGWEGTPPKRVPGAELVEARRHLCEATYRFLVRCFGEGLLDEVILRRTCDSLGLGVEASDLRKRS